MQNKQLQTIIRKSGTSSLPKINLKNSTKQKQQTKKPFKAIHKVGWSIAPQCLLQEHQGKQVMYICINPKCQELTRLVCEVCFFKNHAKHSEQFIAVDQVKKGTIDGLRYWPFQKKYRKIYQFINKHQQYVSNMVQDVNATFNAMAMRILSSIDKIRHKLLKQIDSFYLKYTTKKQFSDKVKKDLQDCFQLKRIQQTVKSVFNKQVRHDIFQDKMKHLLNDHDICRRRQILLSYFDNTEKGKDMIFDKMQFLQKQNWIIEQIHQQQITLKQTKVTVDESSLGVEKIIPQLMGYLEKASETQCPLTFDTQILEDGSKYVGFYKNGQRSMLGMRSYKNGFIYYGQFALGAKNGWGVYQNAKTGYKYSGYWRQDRKNGYGRQQTLATVYQGSYLSDKKDGFGVLIKDGVRFQIGWKNDKKHGQGKRIQKDGTQHDIYYLNGAQSKMKSKGSNSAFDLKALTKKFTASTGPKNSGIVQQQKKQRQI